ncbi:hypothetical protein V1517DRAFT_311424 [Lipomyces orientalis]|uniref:Uncharacterized protein n=1 Tax=Lipomyces orientalis TaxID=1233043 RepID=A0ACC3TYP2_9ASCO
MNGIAQAGPASPQVDCTAATSVAASSPKSFFARVLRRLAPRLRDDGDLCESSKSGESKELSLASKIVFLFIRHKEEVLPPAPTSLISENQAASLPSPLLSKNVSIGGACSPDANIISGISAVDSAPHMTDVKIAQNMFVAHETLIAPADFTKWLGDPGRLEARTAYMSNFHWTDKSIITSLRSLCERIYLRGEAQQIDRILDAFVTRWCECNPSHRFYSKDVVYTLAYSILLLNTDHHWTDISSQKKLTRQQFVTNTLSTILHQLQISHDASEINVIHSRMSGSYDIQRALSVSSMPDDKSFVSGGPHLSDRKAWISSMEGLLRNLYLTISRQPLPLNAAYAMPLDSVADSSILDANFASPYMTQSATSSFRSPSVLRKHRTASSSSSSRPKLTVHHPSSLTDIRGSITSNSPSYVYESIDNSRPHRRPSNATSLSSIWSYQDSARSVPVGLAGAVSEMIIREESALQLNEAISPDRSESILGTATSATSLSSVRVGTQSDKLIDAESEVRGAPWAKEGLLKHRRRLDRHNQRAKNQSWEETFVVVQRGYLKTFKFYPSQGLRKGVFGGGNWTENASMRDCIRLNQSLASYISGNGRMTWKRNDADDTRTWILSLPGGAEHVFEAGTAYIAEEFVDTCNYWAARLSKEPLQGGIGNIEYGWGSNALNMVRSSRKQRSRLVRQWREPPLNLVLSGLDECSQLNSLLIYIEILERDIEEHSQAKKDVIDKLPNGQLITHRATSNWHRKNLYLKRELKKYRRYVAILRVSLSAQQTPQKEHGR